MPAETIRVEVVYAVPTQAWSQVVELSTGATANEAAARSEFAARIPGFDNATVSFAVFGKAISAATILRDGDRLELLRPLIADPKQARRRRAKRQRTAG